MVERIVLVHNPTSTRANDIARGVVAPLQNEHIPYTDYPTKYADSEHNIDDMRSIFQDGDTLLCAGGDGTAVQDGNAVIRNETIFPGTRNAMSHASARMRGGRRGRSSWMWSGITSISHGVTAAPSRHRPLPPGARSSLRDLATLSFPSPMCGSHASSWKKSGNSGAMKRSGMRLRMRLPLLASMEIRYFLKPASMAAMRHAAVIAMRGQKMPRPCSGAPSTSCCRNHRSRSGGRVRDC